MRGLALTFAATDRLPLRVPVADGVKLTATEHCAPACRTVGHVLVWLKSPDAEMVENCTSVVPEFVRSTVCDEGAAPNSTVPKVNDWAESARSGPSPIPCNVAVSVDAGLEVVTVAVA